MTTRISEEDRIRSFFFNLPIVNNFISLVCEVVNIFRINDLIDLPVVDSVSYRRLCTIHDVIVDLRENRVYALVCKEKLFKRSLEAIPYRNVVSVTQNGIGIVGNTSQISLRELSMKHRRFQSFGTILGKLVLSSRGDTLGIVRDLLIDTNSGIIKAYELSEGYLDDFISGRHIVGIDYDNMFTGKSIVINEHNIHN